LKNSKEGNKIRQKRWVQRHPEKAKELKHNQYLKHKQSHQEWQKQYRQKNRIKINQKHREYRQAHPEQMKLYKIRHAKKYGIKLGHAIVAWSQQVKKRDNYQCRLCGVLAIHSHHILYQRFYPDLRYNINNGISLCITHHNEIHGRRLS